MLALKSERPTDLYFPRRSLLFLRRLLTVSVSSLYHEEAKCLGSVYEQHPLSVN